MECAYGLTSARDDRRCPRRKPGSGSPTDIVSNSITLIKQDTIGFGAQIARVVDRHGKPAATPSKTHHNVAAMPWPGITTTAALEASLVALLYSPPGTRQRLVCSRLGSHRGDPTNRTEGTMTLHHDRERDHTDRPHRAPHLRSYTSSTGPLIVTPTFVSRADATPPALRPQDADSAVDTGGQAVREPDAHSAELALEPNPNLAFEHFDEYWRKVHGPKFAYDEPGSSSASVLRYDQIHRLPSGPSSAWPPPYSADTDADGRLVAAPAERVPTYRRPRWDGLAYITYSSADDVFSTLGQEKFAERIIADERTVFRKVTRGLAEEHIILPSRRRREAVSLVRILVRESSSTRKEFQSRWLADHAAVVLSQTATHSYVRRYAQLHTFDTTQEDPDGAAMDVIEIFGFASLNDVEDYLTDPSQRAVAEHELPLLRHDACEYWTGVNYTIVDRLYPELATRPN
jgi:hypothetical protein